MKQTQLVVQPVKVSVGIPVFNEANNIASVIQDILRQQQDGWELVEVLVYNDGSTDATVEQAKTVNNLS